MHVADYGVPERPTPAVRPVVAGKKILATHREKRAMAVSRAPTIREGCVRECGDVKYAAAVVKRAVGGEADGVETAPG